jgi:hypothetical protein
MISFHPDLKEVAMATNGEYIFVIDRSGKDNLLIYTTNKHNDRKIHDYMTKVCFCVGK